MLFFPPISNFPILSMENIPIRALLREIRRPVAFKSPNPLSDITSPIMNGSLRPARPLSRYIQSVVNFSLDVPDKGLLPILNFGNCRPRANASP